MNRVFDGNHHDKVTRAHAWQPGTPSAGPGPVAAGNVRIDGLYFERQGTVPPRLVERSTIRVGLSAQGYPFPAPTGIIDYRLQKLEDERLVSVVGALNAYAAPSVELDAKLPIAGKSFGIAAGVSYAHEEYYDGSDAPFWRAALVPRWQPSEDIEIMPFWSAVRGREEEVAPTIITAGSYLPPEIERRRYFGQQWADIRRESVNYGVIAKARIGDDWALAAVSRCRASYGRLARSIGSIEETSRMRTAVPPLNWRAVGH